MNVNKKVNEILSYRETRNGDVNNEFLLTITSNFLKNISLRSNFIHGLLKEYNNKQVKADDSLKIAIGLYVCSLVACWETYFRDVFIFLCNNDENIKRRLDNEYNGKIIDNITVGEFHARKFNFQNLRQTREAFDDIFNKQTQELTEYFNEEVFSGVVMTTYPLILKWIQEKVFKEKVDDLLKKAFEIRHKVTHDANYIIDANGLLLSEIEAVFQIIPQLFIGKIATDYSQKRIVFNTKELSVRITDTPTEDEINYAFSVEDFFATDYEVKK